MDSRTGFYLLLKDVENPRFADNSTWWHMFSSYVYTSDDDVAQSEHVALKGELLEALEPDKQPEDTHRIALRAVKQSFLRLECKCEDLKQINFEEMKSLIAVCSYFERCRIIDDGYLSYGGTLKEGDEVTVMIKDIQKDVSGVVRYKGPVSPYDGTMFGIEILDPKFRRQGSCDGSFQCKRYFRCPPGSGLFVSLDKLCVPNTNPVKQDDTDEPSKDEALYKESAKTEAKNKNVKDLEADEKMNKNCKDDNDAANVQNSENELSNDHGKENNDSNVTHDENKSEWDANENDVLSKSYLETEGSELKSIVESLQQQLLKVNTELEEKEKKWKEETMEWEMKMGHSLVTQNNLRDHVTQLEKRLENETVARCGAEERLNEEQKRWKKQVKGFSREWEEFEKRLLEERTLRTNVEQRQTECHQQLEQERSQKLAVQAELEQAQNAVTQQASDFERHRQYFEYRIRELENAPRDVQATAPANDIPETRDWLINREEIHVTAKCLGKGAWGQVVEGSFRGCPVAVKQIHDLILSPHNRRLFEREMSIASHCRHPCLLQFIGATNDNGNPLFVTELMDTNLRSILESRSLTDSEIVTISRDVAMALNYLHLNKPLPIIHRDISSANVLLWKRDDRWRGKVSDYGAANFMRQCRTINPGAVIYSAPEAFSIDQTPKIDVFSFGLLLCEMSIRELPVPNQTQRQVALVANQRCRDLISKCIQEDHIRRPTMEDVLHHLDPLLN